MEAGSQHTSTARSRQPGSMDGRHIRQSLQHTLPIFYTFCTFLILSSFSNVLSNKLLWYC